MILSEVCSAGDHVSGGPSGDLAQSNARIRALISPLPGQGATVSFLATDRPSKDIEWAPQNTNLRGPTYSLVGADEI